jgi:hypothetical protein
VATLNQREDRLKFETLQTSTILHTTTTILLQIIFKSNPPKRFEKFKYFLHAAISSNTLCAKIWKANTCYYPMDFGLHPGPFVIITLLVPPLHQTKLCSHAKSERNDHIITMPSTLASPCHCSSPPLSGHAHHVNKAHHTQPRTLVPSLAEDTHGPTVKSAPITPRVSMKARPHQ